MRLHRDRAAREGASSTSIPCFTNTPLPRPSPPAAHHHGPAPPAAVYIDIIGDVLVGDAGSADGMLPQLAPAALRGEWYLSRPFVLLVLTVGVLAPLASMRNMGRLGAINVIGLASLGLFAGSTVWLAAGAMAHGAAHPLRLWPDLASLGPPGLGRVIDTLSILPIVLTAVTCHQSIHPLRQLLHPYKWGGIGDPGRGGLRAHA